MLFIKKQQCEEVLFRFTKSIKILAHSFCFGDDFNYMVCTNNMITLYEIILSQQKVKKVKEIPITIDTIAACYFEPMANVISIIDTAG